MTAFIRMRNSVSGRCFPRSTGLAAAALALAFSCSEAGAQCRSGNNAFIGAPCSGAALGESTVAIGDGARAFDDGASAYGFVSEAGVQSVALGFRARARGVRSVTIGNQAGSSIASPAAGQVVIGSLAGTLSTTPGPYSVTIGGGGNSSGAANADGGYAIAIGGSDDFANPGARAFGFRSVAIGQATYSADFGTSLGWDAKSDFAATAIGTNSTASALESLAVGRETVASGQYSSAFGRVSLASGRDATALGANTRAEAISTVAVGNSAVASANNAAAFGREAIAGGARSVAIGSNSRAPIADTVSVGSNSLKRRIMNVAPGVADNDAVTVAQLEAARRAFAGNSAPSVSMTSGALRDDVARLNAAVQRLEALVQHQQRRIADLESNRVAVASP